MLEDQTPSAFRGRTFAQYRIVEPLGHGGMGEVFLAEDTRLGRKVALKFLPASLGNDDSRVRRFEQEALAASALNHPNIVTVYEFEADHGRQFLVTEYVDGKTLREALRRSTVALEDVVRIAEQTAAALAAAHRAGIVHRDIKPENIMVRDDGIVKVVDFGLAKLAGDSSNRPLTPLEVTTPALATMPGIVLGTVAYMSPEQARGKDVDERTDIWSLGVVLYEMLSGIAPFAGESPSDIIAAILKSDPPLIVSRVGAVPDGLARLVDRALQKNRDQRYQHITDLLGDLRTVERQLRLRSESDPAASSVEAVPAVPQGAKSHSGSAVDVISDPRVASRATHVGGRSWLTLATATVVVLALGGVGALVYSRRGHRSEESTPLRPARGPIAESSLATKGEVSEAVISPDGRLFAYVAKEEVRRTVYVQPIAGGDPVAIVPPPGVVPHDLSFSRDSSRLYLLQYEPRNTSINELYEVSVTGGHQRKVITDVDSRVSIAPSGDRFAFRRNSPENHESSIIIAALDGSGERRLATRQVADAFANNPVWSPDGRTIASAVFNPTAGRNSPLSIVVIDVADGSQRLLGHASWRWTRALAWAADGKELLLDAEDRAGPFQIWRVAYPGGDVLNATNDAHDYTGISVTSDGSALLSVRVDETAGLFVAPVDDLMHPQRVSPDSAVGFHGVSWMPDNRILFSSGAIGNRDISTMNADGSHVALLTSNTGVNENPVATSDGRYIVFQAERSGSPCIWRMKPDGSDPKQLTFGPAAANTPSVTPDGQWIVYNASDVADERVFKVSIDGGTSEKLTTADSSAPVVSPDGKSMVVSYWPGGTAPRALSIISIQGGLPSASFRVPATTARWERDGRALIYVDSTPGYSNFMRLPLDTGTPEALTAFTSFRIPAFDISRDGRRLLFVRASVRSKAVLILGFR